VPVLCVGGLAMGGTGKTPMVLHLARRLAMPGILTRGYKRLSPDPVTVVRAGEQASVRDTGDEAQIFVRAGIADVAIGANRHAAGQRLTGSRVILLDDGFQHRRLHRDFDLVLLDAQDPFAGGAVFPLGRLREDPAGLRRAHAVVLTRVQRGREYRELRRRIQAIHPDLPVFSSHVVPEEWKPRRPDGPAAAFCGLGNPASFWATLRKLDVEPCYRWAFGDHHQYRPTDLRRLRHHAMQAGATHLLTTEKDAMNLPDDAVSQLMPLTIHYLPIGIALDEEEELLRMIRQATVS